jgi:hypothetical protein
MNFTFSSFCGILYIYILVRLGGETLIFLLSWKSGPCGQTFAQTAVSGAVLFWFGAAVPEPRSLEAVAHLSMTRSITDCDIPWLREFKGIYHF